MSVHIWKGDKYLGDLFFQRRMGQAGLISNTMTDEDRAAVVQVLFRLGGLPENDFFTVKAAEKTTVEFGSEEWLHLAALLFLPGYRVHVIAEAPSEQAFN